jgi:large subunit ribosomal protein L5
VPALTKEFGYTNVMAVPKIAKVVVNMGLGEATSNAKIHRSRRPTSSPHHRPESRSCAAPRSRFAAFKVRKGQPIATSVTLRGERMYDFSIGSSASRCRASRDFPRRVAQGVRRPRQLHARPEDQLLFPEIDYMKVDKSRGMNVSVVTTAKTDQEARKLLQLIGMPFRTRGNRDKQWPRPQRSRRNTRHRSSSAAAQPLPPVRPPARVHAQVRAVPAVLPQAGAAGRSGRRHEE